MKRILTIAILFTVLLSVFWACTTGGNTDQTRPVMYAMVNSVNWRCADPHARISENSIVVYGTSANGQTIQLRILAGEKGEYALNMQTGHEGKFIPNMSDAVVAYSTNSSTQGTGMAIINSINEESKTVSGSFYFKGYRATDGSFKSISDGTFTNVPYKFINTVDTSVFDNVMYATVSDESWVPNQITAVKNDTAIIITGTLSASWESLTIILPLTTGAGVHYITAEGPVIARFQQAFYTYIGTAGSCTISQHDTERQIIRATFFFNFVDNNNVTRSITAGNFEVMYIDESAEE
ncbi:MAG: hypothetical protein KBB11_11000 [Bacteroidales bacterium]|nr:hypothetical protein [Bacteroidales bacterium]